MMHTSRRTFLGALAASLPAARTAAKQKPGADPSAFRFAIAGCEFDLAIKPYGKISSEDLAFIDQKTQRRFCLPKTGNGNGGGCLAGFRGALTIARYTFHPSLQGTGPTRMRERVIMIDHDSRLN